MRPDSPDGVLRSVSIGIAETEPNTLKKVERIMVERLTTAGAEGIEVDFNTGGAEVRWHSDDVTEERGRRLVGRRGQLRVHMVRSPEAVFMPALRYVPYDGPALVASAAIQAADEQAGGAWEVGISLTPEGVTYLNGLAARCFQMTAPCESGQGAMVLDGEVVSQFRASGPSWGGRKMSAFVSDSEVDIRDLAAVLDSGPLPVAPRYVGRVVSADRRQICVGPTTSTTKRTCGVIPDDPPPLPAVGDCVGLFAERDGDGAQLVWTKESLSREVDDDRCDG